MDDDNENNRMWLQAARLGHTPASWVCSLESRGAAPCADLPRVPCPIADACRKSLSVYGPAYDAEVCMTLVSRLRAWATLSVSRVSSVCLAPFVRVKYHIVIYPGSDPLRLALLKIKIFVSSSRHPGPNNPQPPADIEERHLEHVHGFRMAGLIDEGNQIQQEYADLRFAQEVHEEEVSAKRERERMTARDADIARGLQEAEDEARAATARRREEEEGGDAALARRIQQAQSEGFHDLADNLGKKETQEEKRATMKEKCEVQRRLLKRKRGGRDYDEVHGGGENSEGEQGPSKDLPTQRQGVSNH